MWVIDTKRYFGLVTSSGGGAFSEPELRVAGRRRTPLADAVRRQMDIVAAALDAAASGQSRPPVSGILCFVGAEWPLIGSSFAVRGVTVSWHDATVKLLARSGRADGVA